MECSLRISPVRRRNSPSYVANLGNGCKQTGSRESCSDSILLAAHEAAANAIEHAQTPVRVTADQDENKIVIEVADSGSWRPARFDDLERGRGLTILALLMKHIDIQATPTGTIVRMTADLTAS